MLQHLPNALTTLRLLLVAPLCLLILEQSYLWALWIGFFAGITDLLDGFFARRLQAFSRLGAILDPIADKALIILTFLCLAQVELIPWYLAVAVVARDLIIMTGAGCYYFFIGPFEFAATLLSKCNMAIQVAFCALVLAAEAVTWLAAELITYAGIAVIAIAVASGLDYVVSWTSKAVGARKDASNG